MTLRFCVLCKRDRRNLACFFVEGVPVCGIHVARMIKDCLKDKDKVVVE